MCAGYENKGCLEESYMYNLCYFIELLFIAFCVSFIR